MRKKIQDKKKHSRKLFFFVCKVAEIQIEMWETLEESYKTADLHGPEDKKKNTNKMFYKSAIDNIKAKLYSVHEVKIFVLL